MKLLFIIRGIISIVFIVLIILTIDLSKVISFILSLPFSLLIIFLIPFLLTTIINTFSLNILLRSLNHKIHFPELCKIKFISRSIGLFFPSQIGELSILPLLKTKNVPFGPSLAAFLADKLISLIVLTAFALYGILSFFQKNTLWNSAIFFLVLFLGIVFCIRSAAIRNLIRKYLLRKYSSLFSGFYKNISVLAQNYGALCLDFLLTITWIFSTAVIIYFIFLHFQYYIPLLTIISIQAIGSISVLLPISISGIGVRESITIFLYTLYGVDPSLSGAIFLLFLFTSYIMGGITLLLTAKDFNVQELRKSIVIKKMEDETNETAY